MKHHQQVRGIWMIMLGMMVVGEASEVSVELFKDPTGASVDILNAMDEPVVMHCWSRETDFGAMSFPGGSNYYWAFHPNIFGRTLFTCSFLWREWKQEFAVWKGSHHADRPVCCNRGQCSYKVCADGIWTALIVETEDDGDAEAWVLMEPWLENS